MPSGAAAPVVLLTRSTLNVRSSRRCTAAGGSQYSGFVVSVMPCSGRSIDATMKHASAKESAMARASVRLPRDAVLHDDDRPAGGGLARAAATWRSGSRPASGTVTSRDLGRHRIEHRQEAARRVEPGTGDGPAASPELGQHRRAVVRVGGRRQVVGQPASSRRRCWPCPAAPRWPAGSSGPVGTISVGCAVTVLEITSSMSSIDCVEKLQVRITDSGLVPWPPGRCRGAPW